MDFFGNPVGASSKGSSTLVSKVTVKKPRPVTLPSSSLQPSKSSSSSSAPSRSTNGGKNGSLSVPSSSSLGQQKQQKKQVRPTPTSRASSSTPKRKLPTAPSRVQSESESSASSSEDGEGDLFGAKPKLKRPRTVTATPFTEGGGQGTGAGVRGRWCLGEVDERGEWGRGWAGFTPCEEVVRGERRGWAGSAIWGGAPSKEGEEGKWKDKYQAYFPQESFATDDVPSVELLYPATGCRERFILLLPTSPREYNPISELRNALRAILEFYIPPSHQHIFGRLPSSTSLDLELTTISTSSPLPPSRLHSPAPTPHAIATPPPDQTPPVAPIETIGDALRKALAPNRRDGPGFLRAMERFNSAMAELQGAGGEMRRWMEDESRGVVGGREWSGLVEMVGEQAYSRVVGPYSNELEHHPKHPDEVSRAISGKEDAYGELRHNFMSKIIEQTNLGPDSVFVDLGSGVANCVLQTALQAGSKSYGYELLPVPAHCARLQLGEVKRRWAMWGLKGCLDVDVGEGDFRVLPGVAKRLREADVVLVNNEVFPPSLNADLTNMFLDLKDGAIIVSLKPFVPEGFRMTESNCDSFAAIVRLSQHTYQRDWVSWKGESGSYYLQVIDRSARMRFEEEMTGGRRRGR